MAPGVWKITYGVPEKHLPSEFKQPALPEAMQALGGDEPPFDIGHIQFARNATGVLASIGVKEEERFYGFGLQVNSFEQRHMRRDIRINSWIGNLQILQSSDFRIVLPRQRSASV